MKNDTFTLTSGPISAVITVTGSFTSDEVWNASFNEITDPDDVEIAVQEGFDDVVIIGTKEDTRRVLQSKLDDLASDYSG